MNGTGDVLSLRDTSKAIGAIISTVATFSTNAEIIPLNAESQMIAQTTLFEWSIMVSAI